MKSVISAFVLLALILSSGVTAISVRNSQKFGSGSGVPLEMESSTYPSMVSGGLSSQHGGLLSGNLAHRFNGLTIFELGQKSCGTSNYEVTGSTINSLSQYPLGILFGTAQIVRPLTFAASAIMYKTAAIRFRMHLFGTWTGQSCSVNTNDDTVFRHIFSGTNIVKDVEIQVPYSPTVLNLAFSCETQGLNALGWTITDTGYHFSTCPMEYIGDVNDGGCRYVGTSLFSGLATQKSAPIVQETDDEDTPAWANGLSSGTTDTNSQIIVIHRRPASSSTLASSISISQLIKAVVYLTGPKFDYSAFTVGDNSKIGITYFNNYPVLGSLSGTTHLSHSFSTLPTTKSAAVRMRMYLLGSWNAVPFTFHVGGSPVHTMTLSGENTHQDIELQFVVAIGNQPMTLSFGITGETGSPQLERGAQLWAVSDVAIVVSNAPVGKVYSQSTNGFVAVPHSLFTALLNGVYNKQLPDIQAQPIWLNKVISGLFNPAFDTIAVNGAALQLGEANQILNHVNILGGKNAYAKGVTSTMVSDLISVKLMLVGAQADITPFTGIGSAKMTFLQGQPVLGLLSIPAIVSTGLNALATTQSGILRLRLHTVGVWANVPFGFQVGGNNVYTTQITGTNTHQDIELSFPMSSNQQAPLTFGIVVGSSSPIAQEQLSGLKWAVSNVAIVYSNAPVGQIYNVDNKELKRVPGSFFTILLNNIYNQQFPGYSVQPAWLNKVALGLYSPRNDIIAINGSPFTIAQAVTLMSELPNLLPVSLHFVGSSFNNNGFSDDLKNAGLTYANGYPVYGTFSGPHGVSTILKTVPTTQSVALRLRLHVLGVWNNVGVNFRSNGMLVLATNINGANEPIDIELQFAVGASQKIPFTIALQDEKSQLQYALSDVAIVYSNAPVGQIHNMMTGKTSQVVGSFFTPLLNTIYTTGFPGYSIQPIWLQKVQMGILSNKFDIIGVNSNTLPLSSIDMTVQTISNGLKGLLTVVPQIIGADSDASDYDCGCKHRLTNFNGIPVLGTYSYGNVLTTTLNVPLSTQSIGYRFNLYLKGNWINVPFGITANDVNVLNVQLTGSNQFQQVELQFPYTGTSQQQVLLALSISQSALQPSQLETLQWAIGNVAVVYSNAPVGQVYNLATGGFNNAGNSLFSVLLNSYYPTGFSGIKTQPIWTQYVKNGVFSTPLDIIAINGASVNFGIPAALASFNILPVNAQAISVEQIPALNNFYTQNAIKLDLVGRDFNMAAYDCTNADMVASHINGVRAIGGLADSSICTTTLQTMPNIQAIAYRFTLHLINAPASATFKVLANNVPVLSTTLTNEIKVYQIELQFAATGKPIQLAMNFEKSSTPIQWAFGQIGYALSTSLVGTIFNVATGKSIPITTSYLTALLNSLYLAQIPGYSTQPNWLSLVVNGNFNAPSNIIAIDGKVLNFNILNVPNALRVQSAGTISAMFPTMLQLVGTQFNLANFASPDGISMINLNNMPVLGMLQSTSVLTTTIFPLLNAKAAIYRLSLHVVGVLSSQPFYLTANGVNVFSVALTGENQIYNIEAQFPTNNQQAIVLGLGFILGQQKVFNMPVGFQWGINNVAISFSTTAVGTILVPATGEARLIQGSYFTPLLSSIFGGKFLNVAQQPSWLMNVLNNACHFDGMNGINGMNGMRGMNGMKGMDEANEMNRMDTKAATTEFVAINGKLATLPSSEECNTLASNFISNSMLSFQLLGAKMNLAGWNVNTGTLSSYMINGVSLAGPFNIDQVLSNIITAPGTTQAVALRFNLYLVGSAVAAPFYVKANGANVLTMELTGANQFRLFEIQFTAASNQPISLAYGFDALQGSSTPFQWSLGEVTIAFSSTPAGTILSIVNNSPIALQNSYFTPLFNSYFASTIKSLSAIPTWLSHVQAGQFSTLTDTMFVNGKAINLENSMNNGIALVGLSGPSVGATIAFYQALRKLHTPMTLSTFFAQTGTILRLVGSNFDITPFSSTGSALSVQMIFGKPALGYLLPADILTTAYALAPSARSAAIRFSLFLVGNVMNTPFTVTTCGVPVLSTNLNGENMIHQIEAQYALPDDCKDAKLEFSFGSIPESQFRWAISNLAISLSSSPVGTIFNTLANSALPIQGSYYTALLNIYSNNQIVGHLQQPSWLATVLLGQFNPLNNIIAVENKVINLESIALPSYAFANFAPTMLQSTQTILQLVGGNMNLAPWTLSQGTVGVTYINGIPALGHIASTAILSTNIRPLDTTQAIALRFNLYMTGQCDDAPFTISANGLPALTFNMMKFNNEYRLVEAQFPILSMSGNTIPLTFSFGATSAPFKWAIGDLAYTLSNTPVGTIFNTATGNIMPIKTSYFTALLSAYRGSFPGYTTQPIWLAYVLNGQFNKGIDIIGINGQLIKDDQYKLAPEISALSAKLATIVLTSGFPSLNYLRSATLGANNILTTFYTTSLTYLKLAGDNFDFPEFSSSNSPLQVISIDNFPALGGLNANSILRTSISTIKSTQAIATRFGLYMIGQCMNMPFSIKANDADVLNTVLSGTNTFKHIELQFPASSSATIPLTMGFNTENVPIDQQDCKWGISEMAVHLSPTPVGTIFNSVTGGLTSVGTSYFAPLLNIYFQGQVPGANEQPSWLAYVLNGQFTNKIDIMAVNGKLISLPDTDIGILSLQASGNLLRFNSQTSTLLSLVGPKFDLGLWRASSINPMTVLNINGIPALGSFGPSDVLFTVLTALPQTQSVALRFTLFMNGKWENTPFSVAANGINVLQISLTGENQYRLVEVQIPFTVRNDQTQITLAFSIPNHVARSTLQWAISQVAIAYSNAPVGQIFSPMTGTAVSLLNSYFTPLLNAYMPGQFQGYNNQPIWLNYVRSGHFTAPIDVISVGGQLLNLEIASINAATPLASFMTFSPTAAIMFTNRQDGLSILQTSLAAPSTLISNFLASTKTIIQLVGRNLDYTAFSGNVGFKIVYPLHSIPAIGYFPENGILTQTLLPVEGTQVVALRFTIFTQGHVSTAPLTITANGVQVFSAVLNPSSLQFNIEAQFPYTYSECQPDVVLSISFAPVPTVVATQSIPSTTFRWALSQVAISFSNAPLGYIFNPVTNGNSPIFNSYFTPLLQSIYKGSFPDAKEQPIWLNQVLFGQFNSGNDFIGVNNNMLNLGGVAFSLAKSNALAAHFLTTTESRLELVGTNINIDGFSVINGQPALTYIKEIPALGYLTPTSVLQTNIYPLASTQAVALRFQLFMSGSVKNIPFTVTANGMNVLIVMLTGNDEHRLVEIQLPYTYNVDRAIIRLSISFNTASLQSSATNFKWAISQLAVSYSNAPVGFIFSSATGGNVPVTSSYFTQLLRVYYGGSFPGYTSQPSWLNHVLNGKFTSGVDIIAINGVLVKFSTTEGIAAVASAITLTPSFSSLKNLQVPNMIATILPKISTQLLLIGSNPDYTKFIVSAGGALGLTTFNGLQILGTLSPTDTLTYMLTPLAGTQTCVVRFTQFFLGTPAYAPINIAAGDSSVLSTMLTGAASHQNIETQFPCASNSERQEIPLTISFGATNQQFKWGIGQVAITYSNAPVGYILSSATGENIPVTSSFYTPLLGVYLSGSFPKYTIQPSWLATVLNGQFSPQYDIIAMNGKLMNFGTLVPSMIQNNLLNANFLTQTVSVLELVGANFPTTNFAVSRGQMGVTSTINSIQILGMFSPSSMLSYTLAPLSSTRAIALRFNLFITGPIENMPFTVKANGVNVFTIALSGKDLFKNIEVQIPWEKSDAITQIPLTWSFQTVGLSSSSTPFQWAVGQLAIVYSNAPVGHIYSSLTGSNVPVMGSFFTQLLGIHYKGAFPGYKTQPLWVPYVMAGQFNPSIDHIAINGVNLNLASIVTPYSKSFSEPCESCAALDKADLSTLSIIQANLYVPDFKSQTLTVLELVGPTFAYSNFKSQAPFGLVFMNNVASIGNFEPDTTLSYSMMPLTSTKAGIVRFNLYVTGSLTNIPFSATVGGVNVLAVRLTGDNLIQNIEIQFPLSSAAVSVQPELVLSFGKDAFGLPFKWAISQFAISYSNTPVGTIFNTITGRPVQVVHSYLTPLLQNYFGGSFPGYTIQPQWLANVLTGEFANDNQIIAIKGVVLNLGTPVTRATELQVLLAQSQFLTQTKTVLELTGPTFEYSRFSVQGSTLGTAKVGLMTVLGQFAPSSVLSYTLSATPYSKSIAVRFTLMVSGTTSNLPFTITNCGETVLNSALSGTDYFRNVEIQFPLASSTDNCNLLNIRFGNTANQDQQFTWSLGQFAISYNNAPVSFILSNINKGYNAVPVSYFAMALQNFYGNSFPGYQVTHQPAWLHYVRNGQFNNQLDLIAIRGVSLNLATGITIPYSPLAILLNTAFDTIPVLQANKFGSIHMSQALTVLELVGANFNLSPFKSSTPFGIVYSNSIPMLGHLKSFSTLTYNLQPIAATQAGILRFQLLSTGSMANVPFVVSANNINILNVVLSGNDVSRNIEIQFPLAVIEGQTEIPLTLSFQTSSLPASAANFKWGISQFAVSYSNAPVGFYLNSVTGGYAPVCKSYFTQVLPIYHGKTIQGSTLAQQPNWLSYVLNGQFSNTDDIISINGNVLNFDQDTCGSHLQVQQATNFASASNGQIQTVLELVGSNFPINNFVLSTGPVGIMTLGNIQVLGSMPAAGVLTYQLSPLATTKTGILRFMLFVEGPIQNVPFVVGINGVNVLHAGLSGNDMFHNIEVQFPLSQTFGTQIPLTMNFAINSLQVSVPTFKWSIGQLSLTYSNAPIGFIFNSYNGGYSPISHSFYTPLMGIFYGSNFPGYTEKQQPIWLSYVRNGQFQNGIDIIAMNNVILNFAVATSPISNALTNMKIFLNNNAAVFQSQTQTFLQLVGPKFDYSAFTSPASFSLLHINSVPVIGYFNPTSVVSTTLIPMKSTQAVALRFTVFLLGENVNAPLMVTANGAVILNAPISTSGYYQNVEIQFPHTSSLAQPNIVLGITFGTAQIPFQWALSQVAVSYSIAPVGHIYNSFTGGNTPLVNSYFTTLLQGYLGGSFPGYTAQQQPIWLSYVLNGQFNNANDIIVVNSKILNFDLSGPFSVRNSLIKGSFLLQSMTNLELVGADFKYPGFTVNSGELQVVTLGSVPVLGQLLQSAVLSYKLAPLVSTQSVNLRFMLFVSGPVANVPFVLNVNNVQILSEPITCTDGFRNIEVQFPHTINSAQNVLTFSFGTAGPVQSFKWGISQMAVAYSNAPVGFVFDYLKLGYSPIQLSYFTPALANYMSGSFAGYTTQQQPIWLAYVMNGQFNNAYDIIVRSGKVMNFAPYSVTLQSSIATPINGDLASLKILQANTIMTTVTPQLSTVLELVGLNFRVKAFTYNFGNFGINYIDNAQVLGHFQPSTVVSYSLTPLASTQAIIVRFNLHTIGTLSAVPFSVMVNQANVLMTPITSTNALHHVEFHIPHTVSGSNQYVLSFSFNQPQTLDNFKWALGQFAVSYSNAPVGHVYNSVTGQLNAITTSFYSMVLPTYYKGAFPGYQVQPTWLSHVLNGQFVNSVDIVAIDGDVLNFGRLAPSSIGILQLSYIPQSSSSILNYVPYLQTVGNQVQYTGVTQNLNGLYNFNPLVVDLVGSQLSNIGQWTVSRGNINTITLNGMNVLGYFSPNVVLTRQYLNLGNYRSVGTIFQLFVKSPTGFNFRVQANGITILQQAFQAGTYDKTLEAHFQIAEQNVVLTFSADVDSGVSLPNSGGWAIGSVGFLNNKCDIRNFYNLNVNNCQYGGNSVFQALSFVNYRQGLSQLTAQPSWFLSFTANRIAAPNHMYYINNANVQYLSGIETDSVLPLSIHQIQYALRGGNKLHYDLIGNNFNIQAWNVNTGAIQTSTIGDIKVLGTFNLGTILTVNLATAPVHASVILRFRLHGVGAWNAHKFYTTLNGAQILQRELTLDNDFRDIELQIVHKEPIMQLTFGVNTNNAILASGAGFALSNFVMHLNPCTIKNTYNVLLNTCVQAGNTAIYNLHRTDYFGQFNNNAGLNLIYLNKFQNIFRLEDDGREIYGSWTGESKAFEGKALVELTGDNFDYSNWKVRGTRTKPYTSQLYGSTAFGPYEHQTVIRRVFSDLPTHTTVVGRVRLYLVGAWNDQNTIILANGSPVFKYILGFTNTYQDIEFTFDNAGTTLELSFMSGASTSAGAREGLQYGISNFALYLSPCIQRSYFNIGSGSCAKTTGYSTFYNLVQSNLQGIFPVLTMRPVWTVILTPVSGINELAHEVYSFLKGSQLEVITGVRGKPQFIDLDLDNRLKQQIDSKPIVSSGSTAELSFLSGRSSKRIVGDYKNGTISSYGEKYENLFGANVLQSNIKEFKFAFGLNAGSACVGLIETKDINSLDLNADLRKNSLTVCSDDLTQADTKFLISINTEKNIVSFKDQFYNQDKELKFKNASNLYYTVQFFKKGTVYFGKSADNFQPSTSENSEDSN